MRMVALYHPKSDHSGRMEDYAHEYQMRHPGREIELLSLDSREGWELAKLYDVVRYPALLIITDDGRLQQLWQEQQLPLMSEVDAYLAGTEIGVAKAQILSGNFV